MRTVLPDRKRSVKPTIRAYSAYPRSHAFGFQCLPLISSLIAGSRSLPASSDTTPIVLRPSGSPVPRQSFANWRAWEKPHISGKARAFLREISRTTASRCRRDWSPSLSFDYCIIVLLYIIQIVH